MSEAVELYLQRLTAGDYGALLASFAGAPSIDDPIHGRLRGRVQVQRFMREHHVWLVERTVAVEPLRLTRNAERAVFEALLRIRHDGSNVELPVAIVGEPPADRVDAIRVYHSMWPLEGTHRVRAPLLRRDPSIVVGDIVGEYQRALASGDTDAIVATFEQDGYFREPAGGPYVFRGRAELWPFMYSLLSTGGIGLEYCTATDDGMACAIEFNAVRFGRELLEPQAGIAVYQRGRSGLLHAARIYDDVNVEALASRA